MAKGKQTKPKKIKVNKYSIKFATPKKVSNVKLKLWK